MYTHHKKIWRPRLNVNKTQFNATQEISDGLKWLNDRAWLVGGYILFLAAWCIQSYATQSGISLNFASSDVASVLLPMMAVIIFYLAIFSYGFFIPAIILFISFQKGDSANSAIMLKKAAVRWIGVVFLCLMWVILIFFLQQIKDFLSPLQSIVCQALGFALTTIILAYLLNPHPLQRGGSFLSEFRTPPPNDLPPNFWTYVLTAIIVQPLIIVFIFLIVLSHPSSGAKEIAISCRSTIWVIICVIAVGAIQFFGAYIAYAVKNHRKPIATAFSMGVLLLSLTCIIPFTANFLATLVIQTPLSGGRSCVQLEWSSSAGSEPEILRDENDPQLSKQLKILWEANGTMQVRLDPNTETGKLPREVFFVPTTSHTAIASCKDATSVPNPRMMNRAAGDHPNIKQNQSSVKR